MNINPSGLAAPLAESSRSVMRVLAERGPVTRPQLGDILNFSKPTMSLAIEELSQRGLVEQRGSHKGKMGRTASVYGLGPEAGYVMGIDVGAAQIRAVAYTLDGQELAAIEDRLSARGANSIKRTAAVVADIASRLQLAVRYEHRLLRCIAVAVPRIVTVPAFNPRRPPEKILEDLLARFDVPIIIENNVNCAALGELLFGSGRQRQTFAFLQVGVRIGLGIILNGQLFRGTRGAAGEVGRMPFPWSAHAVPVQEGLEHYLGSDAFLQRALASWPTTEGTPPLSAKDLFERAKEGSPAAIAAVKRHALDVGRLLSGVIGMLDPGLVILGGGVGQNSMLLNGVREVAEHLTWPTDIENSTLGPSGTVLGAMHLAADYGLGLILGEAIQPAVVLSPSKAR